MSPRCSADTDAWPGGRAAGEPLNIESTNQLNSGAAPFDELQRLSIRIGEIGHLLDDKELRWLELSEITQG